MKKVALKNLKDPSRIETADVLTYGKLMFVRADSLADTSKVFVIRCGTNIVAVAREHEGVDALLEQLQTEHFNMRRSVYKTFVEYQSKVDWTVEELP